MAVVVHSIFEGVTEARVLNQLGRICPPGIPRPDKKYGKIEKEEEESEVAGKDAITEKLIRTIGPEIGSSFRCLVMRDLDQGEKDAEVLAGYVDGLNQEAEKRGKELRFSFNPHAGYGNVHVFESKDPEVKMAVHFADEQRHGFDNFVSTTTDDYLLRLLHSPKTMSSFWEELRSRGERRKPPYPWPSTTEAQAVFDLARQAIAILEHDSLPKRINAKLYLTVWELIARDDDSRVCRMLFAKANKDEVEDTFASLLAAIKFLTGD